MTLRNPPPSRGPEAEEQTIWLSSGALRPPARRRASGWFAGVAALALAAAAGGAAWLHLGASREAAVAPAPAAVAPVEAQSAPPPQAAERPQDRIEQRVEAPADAAPARDQGARLVCPIVGDDAGGGVSYGAGFVREPVEEEELPAIVLGSAVWRCLDGRDDPAYATTPALAFRVSLGPDLALPAAAATPAIAAAPAPVRPAPDAAPEPAGEAPGPAPLAMTLSLDAEDPRALLVEVPLDELAERFQTEALTIAAAEFRLANGAPLIRTSRVAAAEGRASRLVFGELPSPATLSRLFWFDVKLIAADGREYALTLQMGRDARVLLGAVIEVDA